MKNNTYRDKCGITSFEAVTAVITLYHFSLIIRAKIGTKTAINI